MTGLGLSQQSLSSTKSRSSHTSFIRMNSVQMKRICSSRRIHITPAMMFLPMKMNRPLPHADMIVGAENLKFGHGIR